MYKYTLIVSQQYHSYHQFLVEHDENFAKNIINVAREIMQYKRVDGEERKEYLGDLNYMTTNGKFSSRYNINDISGDIYIMNFETLEGALYYHKEYVVDQIRYSKGYKNKSVMEHINKYHQRDKIRDIIIKHLYIL